MTVLCRISLILLFLNACSPTGTAPIKAWRHAADGAFAANISPDSSLAVVSSINNGISVWDLVTNEKLYEWQHQGEGNNLVLNIHIAFDNSFVVTSDRETFALWNLATGEPEGFWRIDESSIRDVAVTNQGQGILVGRGNGKVMYFEPDTGRRLEFFGHQEKVNSVDISPNGFYALTGGNDYVAYLWDTRSGQVVHKFTHPSRVTKVVLDDKGRFAFTADSKRQARVWDLTTGKEISRLQYLARQKIFSTAIFSEDGRYLLTGSPAKRMNLWRVADGRELHEWQVTPREGSRPQSAVVYGLGFVNNKQIVSESSSGLAEFWKIDD
ncbi:MAG: WD40 repeat protein [Paraglaciecola sp.]